MTTPAAPRRCIRDQVRDVLVARILDGTYPTGTQLKELALAREFKVSQAPIREALRELEGSGLVTSERFRGTKVRGADFRDMRESYELRILLEARAVELASPYSASLLEQLDVDLQGMQAALPRHDMERYIEHALSFHRTLMAGCGNQSFLTVWDSLHWSVRGRIALRRLTDTGQDLQPLLEMHKALYAKLIAQAPQEAVAAVRQILERITASFRQD